MFFIILKYILKTQFVCFVRFFLEIKIFVKFYPISTLMFDSCSSHINLETWHVKLGSIFIEKKRIKITIMTYLLFFSGLQYFSLWVNQGTTFATRHKLVVTFFGASTRKNNKMAKSQVTSYNFGSIKVFCSFFVTLYDVSNYSVDWFSIFRRDLGRQRLSSELTAKIAHGI